MFEHRNYFPSAGLLLAAAVPLLELRKPTLQTARWTLAIGFVAWSAGVTALRSAEWSQPLRFAVSEALRHPNSPRAQYELGRTLTVASHYDSRSPLFAKAKDAFETAMALPNASVLPEQGLIMLFGHAGEPADPAWWRSISHKLSQRPARAEEINALQTLVRCQLEGPCPPAPQEMLDAFLATLSHTTPLRTHSCWPRTRCLQRMNSAMRRLPGVMPVKHSIADYGQNRSER